MGDGGSWHVVHQDDLLDYLRRAHAGESPDLILLEAYANAEVEVEDA